MIHWFACCELFSICVQNASLNLTISVDYNAIETLKPAALSSWTSKGETRRPRASFGGATSTQCRVFANLPAGHGEALSKCQTTPRGDALPPCWIALSIQFHLHVYLTIQLKTELIQCLMYINLCKNNSSCANRLPVWFLWSSSKKLITGISTIASETHVTSEQLSVSAAQPGEIMINTNRTL